MSIFTQSKLAVCGIKCYPCSLCLLGVYFLTFISRSTDVLLTAAYNERADDIWMCWWTFGCFVSELKLGWNMLSSPSLFGDVSNASSKYFSRPSKQNASETLNWIQSFFAAADCGERLTGGSCQAALRWHCYDCSSDEAVYQKWTDSFEKKEEEVWSLSTSRPLMRTQHAP